MHDLRERLVLLTGAAGGIGSALAHSFAAAGAHLALVDRDQTGLGALANHLPSSAKASVHAFDLSDVARLETLLADVLATHGRIDVLVNNAGVTVHGRFSDHSETDLDRILDINLRAPVQLTRLALPHLRRSSGSHLVLVSSMAGGLAFPFQSAYSASKSGLRGLGAALRIELESDDIGVTTVLPGTIATEFLTNAASHDEGSSTRLSALMQRFGAPPERVAEAVLRGIHRNRATVRVGWDSHLVGFLGWIAPAVMPALLRRAYRQEMLGALGDTQDRD